MKFIDAPVDYHWRMGGNQKSIHKQINKSLDHLYSHCCFFKKMSSVPALCNTDKYDFYILNYALYFIKLSAIYNSSECFDNIVDNELIRSNKFFYFRLQFVRSILLNKIHNIYVCKIIFLLFFPVRQISNFIYRILFEYESMRILKSRI